jgi:hypothetical protein
MSKPAPKLSSKRFMIALAFAAAISIAASRADDETAPENAPLPALDEGYGKTQGVAGPVTFGPSLTLLGLTRPFSIGLEGKYRDRAGAAFFYGFLPELKLSGVSVKYSSWDARVRWYVFRGSFFAGLGYGKQNLEASKTETIQAQSVTGNLKMDTSYIIPHVGWHWVWTSGFFMGMDLGIQLPISRSQTFSSTAPAALQASAEYRSLESKVNDEANKIGKIPLPLLTLLKVGFLF